MIMKMIMIMMMAMMMMAMMKRITPPRVGVGSMAISYLTSSENIGESRADNRDDNHFHFNHFHFYLTSSENIRKSRADNQEENFLHFHFHHFHFHVISSENNGRSRGVVSMTVTSYLDSDDDEVNKNAGCGRIRRVETF